MGAFRNFFLGKDRYLPSRAAYKTGMLRGSLSLIAALVSFGYIFIDHHYGVYGAEPYYLALAVLALVTFLLNRAGRHMAANLLFLTVINLLLFYFAAVDPYESGVSIYFVSSGLLAFALLGLQRLRLALAFAALTVILFCISFWTDVPFLLRRPNPEEYLKVSFAISLLANLIFCVYILYFIMDINRHSEKEILEKNEQLRKANEELDRFVYSASHDLKAPLSSILGLVDLARRSATSPETTDLLKMIEERIDHLGRFITDIMEYSRNSRMDLKTDNVNLKDVIGSVVEDLKFIDGAESIAMDVVTDDPPFFRTDPARLRVILSNLISNSIRHHYPSGSGRYVRIKASRSGANCVIEVEDNGPGIDPEHGERIFEMFYRASETSTGSGLGLYIVNETVAKLGGTIRFSSVKGRGTTFTVMLPAS